MSLKELDTANVCFPMPIEESFFWYVIKDSIPSQLCINCDLPIPYKIVIWNSPTKSIFITRQECIMAPSFSVCNTILI